MFSVIIPVYNGEKFIDDAIESVKRQSFEDWEIVVVNDGSSDNTAKRLEKYSDDEKIRVFNQENGGVSRARNKGIEEAKMPYLTFLDADDIWRENHLEVIRGMIEVYPDAGLYATSAENHMANGEVVINNEFFKNRSDIVFVEDFFKEYAKDKSAKMFNMISTCITKEAAEKAGGFPVGCKIGEDLELSLVIAAYFPVVLTSKATTVYRKENSTATKDVSFDPDWHFFERVKELYADCLIPEERKMNIRRLMEWFTIRRSRHYIIDGQKEKAVKALREVRGTEFKRDYILTKILLMLPERAVKKIFYLRWRGKA